MRQTARPHDLGTRFQILRIMHQNARIAHDCAHQRLAHRVCHRHVLTLIKIALHHVHQDIRNSAGRLIFRQCQRQRGIHHCKRRTAEIVVIGALFAGFFIGDDAAAAHLAARSRDGQHHADRQAALRLRPMGKQLSHIAIICAPIGDRLRRIDD